MSKFTYACCGRRPGQPHADGCPTKMNRTIDTTIRNMVRRTDTVNGGPRFRVLTDDGAFETEPDSMWSYAVNKSAIGKAVTLYVDEVTNRIQSWTLRATDSMNETHVVTITQPVGMEGAAYRLTLPSGESRIIGDAQDEYMELAGIIDEAFAKPDVESMPSPRTFPVGTRVADDDELGTILEWQGESIVRIQYDDGTRSIGRVRPDMKKAEAGR